MECNESINTFVSDMDYMLKPFRIGVPEKRTNMTHIKTIKMTFSAQEPAEVSECHVLA